MIATAAFVLFFVLLALGVLAVAMRGGPRATSTTPPGRRARRVWTVFVPIALVVFGLGIPLWILAANSSGHDKKEVGGVELTDSQARGRVLFAENCSTCHTLRGTAATGKVGPNLDQLAAVQNVELTLNAIKTGRANGNGQMPAGLLDGVDAQNVADYVKAVSGR